MNKSVNTFRGMNELGWGQGTSVHCPLLPRVFCYLACLIQSPWHCPHYLGITVIITISTYLDFYTQYFSPGFMFRKYEELLSLMILKIYSPKAGVGSISMVGFSRIFKILTVRRVQSTVTLLSSGFPSLWRHLLWVSGVNNTVSFYREAD